MIGGGRHSAVVLALSLLTAPARPGLAAPLETAAAESSAAAARFAQALQERAPAPSGDAELDALRERFARAPSFERDATVAALSAGRWRCRRYGDGAWKAEEGEVSFRAAWFAHDEVREYDHPARPDRPYLGYRLTPQGLAAMYGFLWLRLIDDRTLIKEFSDNSGRGTGIPSAVVPGQSLRWFVVCERSP